MVQKINIEVYDYMSGKLIHIIKDSEEPVWNDYYLTFDVYMEKFGLKDAEYHVIWCSEVNNGKQIALCNYMAGTGEKIKY